MGIDWVYVDLFVRSWWLQLPVALLGVWILRRMMFGSWHKVVPPRSASWATSPERQTWEGTLRDVEVDDGKPMLSAERKFPHIACEDLRPSAPFVLESDDGSKVRIIPTAPWGFAWPSPEAVSARAILRRLGRHFRVDPGTADMVEATPGDRIAVSGIFDEPDRDSDEHPYRDATERVVWLRPADGRTNALALVVGSPDVAMSLGKNPHHIARLIIFGSLWLVLHWMLPLVGMMLG